MNSLPSRPNYNEFSEFMTGEVERFAKMEWLTAAVDDIIYQLDIKWKDSTGNSVGPFLDRLESYNFGQFFLNGTNGDVDVENPPENDDYEDYEDLPITDAEVIAKATRFVNIMESYLAKPEPSSRKKRQTDTDACNEITYFSHPMSMFYLFDKKEFSLAAINDDSNTAIEDSRLDALEDSVNAIQAMCGTDSVFIPIVRRDIARLKTFIEMKQYNLDQDGFSSRVEDPSYCKKPSIDKLNECLCECHKMDKVSIHNVYQTIKLMDKKVDIKYFGDIYTFYYHQIVSIWGYYYYPYVNSPYLRFVDEDIGKEIDTFERQVLLDLSGVATEIGLSDFITMMSQPVKIWTDSYDFPKMRTLSSGARKEIQDFFNFDPTVNTRDLLTLRTPDFETIQIKSLCSNSNFTNYCKMIQNFPDLQTTMHLMSLATDPVENDGVKNLLRYNL